MKVSNESSELSPTIASNALVFSNESSSSVHDESLVSNEYARLTLLRRFKVEARRARNAYCVELKAEWNSMRALGKENLSPESLLCEYDVEESYEEYAPWRLRDFDNKLNEKWDLFRFSLNVDFGHEDGRIPLSIPGSGAQSWSHLGHRTEAMWDEIRRTYFGENDVTSATHPSTMEVGGPRFVVHEEGLNRSQVIQKEIDELLEDQRISIRLLFANGGAPTMVMQVSKDMTVYDFKNF